MRDTACSTSYVYDGAGQRVEKTSGSTTSVYVYDGNGRLAATYSSQSSTPTCTTCYVTPDHLGSTRMVTDQSAGVAGRHDYLPFGEEINSGAAGRSGNNYGATDSENEKFTAQVRDSESGLDYL